jgi:hypothetical protein
MKKAKQAVLSPLYITKLAKIQFSLVAVFAVYIIIFDSGNVLTREAVYHHWILEALLLAISSLFWVCTKKAPARVTFVVLLVCIAMQLVLAGYSTYWERGMASMSTILYALPIASMALSGSRTYTVGTSLFAAAVYITACTKYFYDYFNEGYRVQLYGQLFFFSALFLLLGWACASLAHAYTKK